MYHWKLSTISTLIYQKGCAKQFEILLISTQQKTYWSVNVMRVELFQRNRVDLPVNHFNFTRLTDRKLLEN